MIIFIRTQKIYTSFIREATLGNHGHQISIDVEGHPEYFPKEYDVGISFMSTYKVPKSELDKATWYNFHPAPLPEYKGRNLCYHAIMNEEKYFGATIHYMSEEFDEGRIIDTIIFRIYDYDTAGDVSEWAIEASKKLFKRYFMAIVMGVKLSSSENVGGTYYKKRPIDDEIYVDDETKKRIRAITYGSYFPVIDIGGIKYKIVRCKG